MENTHTLTQTLQTYNVDPVHSLAQFRVRHMGLSKVTGVFEAFEGSVRMVRDQLDTLDVEGRIKVASLTTGTEDRDDHLRSKDFFYAEEYPYILFESTGVRNVGDETLKLEGDLTIRGETRPITLDVEYEGRAQDPWGSERVAFTATTRINRKDFGLTWNKILETGSLLVGEEVQIRLEIQAVLENDEE